MKRFAILLIFSSFLPTPKIFSQELKGEPILKVYGNFHKGILEEDKSTAFEIRRVYLGYKQAISECFYAEVKLDIGSPEDQSQYALIRRYSYFKAASLRYSKNKLTAYFGLFDMMQYELQEDFWGYRYIYKSFQDEYNFGPSADIGAGVSYRFNEYLAADLVISNGEGYKNLQSDNAYKTGAGISFFPIQDLTLRIYYDFINKEIIQDNFNAFIGYRKEKNRIGLEYIFERNSSFVQNNHRKGWSVYTTHTFNETWEIFARYDKLNSSILKGEQQPWNLYNDGSAIISGVQYHPVKGINISLNYQDWYAYAKNGRNSAFLFLNLEFKI